MEEADEGPQKTVTFVAERPGETAEAREKGHPEGEKVAQYSKERENLNPQKNRQFCRRKTVTFVADEFSRRRTGLQRPG